MPLPEADITMAESIDTYYFDVTGGSLRYLSTGIKDVDGLILSLAAVIGGGALFSAIQALCCGRKSTASSGDMCRSFLFSEVASVGGFIGVLLGRKRAGVSPGRLPQELRRHVGRIMVILILFLLGSGVKVAFTFLIRDTNREVTNRDIGFGIKLNYESSATSNIKGLRSSNVRTTGLEETKGRLTFLRQIFTTAQLPHDAPCDDAFLDRVGRDYVQVIVLRNSATLVSLGAKGRCRDGAIITTLSTIRDQVGEDQIPFDEKANDNLRSAIMGSLKSSLPPGFIPISEKFGNETINTFVVLLQATSGAPISITKGTHLLILRITLAALTIEKSETLMLADKFRSQPSAVDIVVARERVSWMGLVPTTIVAGIAFLLKELLKFVFKEPGDLLRIAFTHTMENTGAPGSSSYINAVDQDVTIRKFQTDDGAIAHLGFRRPIGMTEVQDFDSNTLVGYQFSQDLNANGVQQGDVT